MTTLKCCGPKHIRLWYAFAVSASLLTSCSTIEASPPAQLPPAKAEEAVTIDGILRWSLDGDAGKARIKSALRKVLNMKPLHGQQFSGDGPTTLSDGNVLTFGWFGELSDQIDIGIASNPCVSPEHASELIGAAGEVTLDADGQDRGKTYKTQRSGSWIEFTTTPSTYRCIDSINIYPARKPGA